MDLEHEHRLTEVEGRAKSNSHRLDEVERRQDKLDDLVASVQVLASQMQTIDSTVKDIKTDVKEMASKPAKRWDAIVEKVLLTIVGAILLYILARLGF